MVGLLIGYQKGRLWLILLHIRETRDALLAEPPISAANTTKALHV